MMGTLMLRSKTYTLLPEDTCRQPRLLQHQNYKALVAYWRRLYASERYLTYTFTEK